MFSVFKAQQIELLRDKGTIFSVLLFPTLLVFILGTMLASLDNPDMEIEPMTIGYFVDNSDAEVATTVQTIVQGFDDVEQVEFTEAGSLASANAQLDDGQLNAFVVFSQPFAMEIHDGANDIQNRAVHAIFEGVARLQGTASVLTSPPTQSDTLRVEEKISGISRSMIDYYSITMIVMMFFMGSATSGASMLYNNRKDGNLGRTLASPNSRVSIYLQYVASSVPFNLLLVGVVMIASTTLLGAHYATSWEDNLLLFVMLFTAGLAASAVSLILGLLVRFNPQPLIMLIMWPTMFLSGTFSKAIFITGFSEFMPPAIIQQAAFDLTLFGQTGRSITVLAVSAVIVVAATITGALLFNRKEVAA